ncbi:ATP-grasp domain-containing protein [Aquicella lusitana]|uniref:ATP-grasp domain-containing protein n=1 Tax=Aquicella lusitana TaxID=254246 RepID=A0A370GME5_9COXI|nr:ATP-grasp domain-containing protein [Aquicella lusitana]RDI44841.1 ATP-grasp domain-containing protein [Aquicella lusitana]VVC73038.1 Alanine-anticapsin ligase BacD [Aquicella lusitana]
MTSHLIAFDQHTDFLAAVKNKYEHFNWHAQTIVFVEPYGASLSLLKHGLSRGFNIIILTANTDFRQLSHAILEKASLAICIDTIKTAEVIAVMESLRNIFPIHAVIPGFEYFVPVAARASLSLGLPGMHPTYVMRLRRKDLMRQALQAAGIQVPRFSLVNSMSDLGKAIDSIGLPAICKPIDAAGSVNVRRVSTKEEATTAALRILEGHDVLWGYPLARHVLYEEYIEGKEYSVEGIVQYGRIYHFSLTEKNVSDQLEFVETGHIVNVPVEAGLKKRIENYVEDVLHHLGANHCPFHAEVRLNKEGKPVLMEIAARLAGDKIGDLINLAREINYFDYVYAAYLGESLPLPQMNSHFAGIRFFYRPEIESYASVTGREILTKYKIEEFVLYYGPGDPIPAFPKALKRLGHVIIKDDCYESLVHALDHIDHDIIFNS